MKRFLNICVEIEETVAKIYRQLATSPRLPNELKMVLENLANDEDDHAMQLRFALRFPAGTAVVEKELNRAPVEDLLMRAKAMLAMAQREEFDVKQALEIGMELEQDFCQAHIGNSMEFRDENLKKMFAALAQDDKVHCQKLLDAKNRFLG